jgi:hypothetical protein
MKANASVLYKSGIQDQQLSPSMHEMATCLTSVFFLNLVQNWQYVLSDINLIQADKKFTHFLMINVITLRRPWKHVSYLSQNCIYFVL